MTNTIHGLMVIDRKPSVKHNDGDVVLVKHHENEWVTGIVRKDDAQPAEWSWGHYFGSLSAAVADYGER